MSYKYNISILAIFKNEESFLPEWIDHYINNGVCHLYLLNDGSTDHSLDIIDQHYYKKYITLLNVEDSVEHIANRQKYLYNKYYHYILEETKWLGVFDLDEFCYSPDLEIPKIIELYDNCKINELLIDWYWFGSNGYESQPPKIIDSFKKRSIKPSKVVVLEKNISDLGYHFEWCCKSFAKTQYITEIQHHYNYFEYFNKTDYITYGRNKIFSVNLSDDGMMFINHYIGAKEYYFNNKVLRGSCNNSKLLIDNKIKLYNIINLNEVIDTRLANQQKLFSF